MPTGGFTAYDGHRLRASKVAAAWRRCAGGRPALLPEEATLVRQHVALRVDATADGCRGNRRAGGQRLAIKALVWADCPSDLRG